LKLEGNLGAVIGSKVISVASSLSWCGKKKLLNRGGNSNLRSGDAGRVPAGMAGFSTKKAGPRLKILHLQPQPGFPNAAEKQPSQIRFSF
jgi:hypothetical protein